MNKSKLNLNFRRFRNLSFIFMEVQIGYSFQNTNASRIFQIFGTDIRQLSDFRSVAPLPGFIGQSLVGLFSDRSWRRIPFILGDTILTDLSLFTMPDAERFIHRTTAINQAKARRSFPVRCRGLIILVKYLFAGSTCPGRHLPGSRGFPVALIKEEK